MGVNLDIVGKDYILTALQNYLGGRGLRHDRGGMVKLRFTTNELCT